MQPAYRKFETGHSTHKIQEDDPDVINHFIEVNKTMPSAYQFTGTFIYEEWLQTIKNLAGKDHLVTWCNEMDEYKQVVIQVRVNTENGMQVVFIRSGRTSYTHPSLYELKSAQNEMLDVRGILTFRDFEIFYNIESGLPVDLIKACAKIKLTDPNINKIHLICQNQDIGLYTKELPIRGKEYEFDLDLHYGDGMQEFHDKQLKRIASSSKGIILLYGEPGTGKSYYIKRLCKDLFNTDKKILYLPNNMVDNLGTPAFNNFLLEWTDDNIESGQKKGLLIIIEDGERVLLKRDVNPHGADGVSNILNSTDGILNDFLNIQILATFNTSIDNIDDAIKRKRRMMGIREFKKLTVENAQRLATYLNVGTKIEEEMTLADIYSLAEQDDDAVLFKDKDNRDKGGMGFRIRN